MKQDNTGNKDVFCRTFHVQAADCRIWVKRIEPGTASAALPRPVLVFLHEGLGCIELWRDFPETLCASAGCSGLLYDRCGYGGSEMLTGPWPLDYLEKESATYLPAVLAACNINDAILIGHSDGGTIALLAAAVNGDPIRGIITEAAHIFVEDMTLAGIRKAVAAFETTDLKKKLSRYHQANTETLFYRWANRWLAPDFRSWNIETYLPKITCPVLVLQGEDDEYGSAAQVQGIVNQVSGPAASNLIPRCGHVPHFQARETVLSAMLDFIGTLPDLNSAG